MELWRIRICERYELQRERSERSSGAKEAHTEATP